MNPDYKLTPSTNRFFNLAKQAKAGEMDKASFERLSTAAAEAVASIQTSEQTDSPQTLKAVSDIFRLVLAGTSGSLIMQITSRWQVVAAVGKGSDKIIGKSVDTKGASVSSTVINNRTPFYFTDIGSIGLGSSANDPNRYSSNNFCSIPLFNASDQLNGVINVAGMSGDHPIFSRDHVLIADVLDEISQIISNEETG